VRLGGDPSIAAASIDGVRNVLASVDRSPTVTTFVHTSSVAAVMRLDAAPRAVFDESDWNDWSTIGRGDAYGYGKTEAERIVASHFFGDARRCVSLNPAIVLGPVLAKAHTKASPLYVRNLIQGNPIPNVPGGTFVDVRDVATAHVEALERSGATGRFVLAGDSPTCNVADIGPLAQNAFPQYDLDVVPEFPPWKVSLALSLGSLPVVGPKVLTEYQRKALTAAPEFANARAKAELGMAFRPLATTLADSITSMVSAGYVAPRTRAE
jgi:nucleoside-diphosphate-sugar epimerase